MNDNKHALRCTHFAAIAAMTLTLSGCEMIALTTLGIGGSTAVNHTLSGMTYRTFTAPMPRVRTASISALKRMGIPLGPAQSSEGNEVLTATARDRQIEIVLEPLSPNTTRMRVTARNGGLLYDSATATEIILQTERVLGS
jgi:hypothetical protein